MIPDITVCPSLLTDGHTTYSPKALSQLFNGSEISHILAFPAPDSKTPEALEAVKNIGRLSLSGAQPKFGMVIDSNTGTLRYSQQGEQSTFILKPRPTAYHILNPEYCAANENLTMQIASQVYRIPTAANGLVFFNDGQCAYLTRRFDVHPGGKFRQEDFASLMGFSKVNGGSDYKYINGSYEECAEVIDRLVPSAAVAKLIFFRMVLFNFISFNNDAHLKNFSLIFRNGEYTLAPAYDLVNTSLHIAAPGFFALEKGLFREGMDLCDTRTVGRDDFMEFGRRIGLNPTLVEKEIATFTSPSDAVEALVKRSFLSEELKARYLTSFTSRQRWITD